MIVLMLVLCVPVGVSARESGDWFVRTGLHTVQPKSDNGSISALNADVEVDGATMFSFNLTYMLTPSIGVELLASAPFKHDIEIGGSALVGVDVELGEKWFVNADVRYMDIDTHATVTAPGLRIKERVDIDPFAVGVNLGYRF